MHYSIVGKIRTRPVDREFTIYRDHGTVSSSQRREMGSITSKVDADLPALLRNIMYIHLVG